MRSRIVKKTVSIIFWLYTERELIQISLLFNSTKFDLKSQHERKGCYGLERTMSICILYRSLEGLKIKLGIIEIAMEQEFSSYFL